MSCRGVGEPNPPRETKTSGTNGDSKLKNECKKMTKSRKAFVRKRRRGGIAGRRVARRQASSDRDRARKRELNIATHNVRTALGRVVKEVPEHEQLFALMDTNARTGRRGGGGSGVTSLNFSMSKAEILSTMMVSSYQPFVPIMVLHSCMRSSTLPRMQLRER